MDKSDYDQFLENEILIHVVVFLAYKIKLFQKLNDGQSLILIKGHWSTHQSKAKTIKNTGKSKEA